MPRPALTPFVAPRQPLHAAPGHAGPGPSRAARCACRAQTSARPAPFPASYTEAVRQAQEATQAALRDGAGLIEIEFPPSGLASVPGDGEGANEMTESLIYLRKFCRIFQANAQNTRIFFPDQKEMRRAQEHCPPGQPSPVFQQTAFQLDYLTRPTLFSDLGLDINKVSIAERTRPSDSTFVIAYPHFNVNEMLAVDDLYTGAAKQSQRPIIVFNGELDRIRSGYYPGLFYRKLSALNKTLLPFFTTAYYVHNFKGSRGGVLFRMYPGPFQVYRRGSDPTSGLDMLQLIHTQDSMPTLREVALNILPSA